MSWRRTAWRPAEGGPYLLLSSRALPASEVDGEDWRQACRGAGVLSAFGLWGPDGALESRLRLLLPALEKGELRAEVRPGAGLEPGRPGIQEE